MNNHSIVRSIAEDHSNMDPTRGLYRVIDGAIRRLVDLSQRRNRREISDVLSPREWLEEQGETDSDVVSMVDYEVRQIERVDGKYLHCLDCGDLSYTSGVETLHINEEYDQETKRYLLSQREIKKNRNCC